jgi:hypothetical protein
VAEEKRTPVMTGGCQCGAVRYALYAEPSGGNICHCRMCQKAFGNFFAPFTGVPLSEFAWTRGEPAIYKSSELVDRGFCRDCGTPLSFRYLDVDRIGVSVGSLDDPNRVTIVRQLGVESRVATVLRLNEIPEHHTKTFEPQRAAKLASRQHPDRD